MYVSDVLMLLATQVRIVRSEAESGVYLFSDEEDLQYLLGRCPSGPTPSILPSFQAPPALPLPPLCPPTIPRRPSRPPPFFFPFKQSNEISMLARGR